ncbi:MAG: sulfotransferase family protein [Gammaproteobacteria bacterium]|nr:MAG: sulfotransferase family protein [Gammaproteobacteria bacterium]
MNLSDKVKGVLLNLYIKFFNHEKVQQSLHYSIQLSKQNLGCITNTPAPYKEITTNISTEQSTSERDDIVFITSRFRSGSTVLWNIFRNIDGCTSYYEPFNERRWFDKNTRGNHVDSTHIGVNDYSKEYDELDYLDKYYNEDWIRESLFMDAKTWAPNMKSYICELIKKANGRPILQFNRIDFRLPWLKHHFPNAKFIHLYRHPRDQWLSFLTDKKLMNKDYVEHNYIDGFYLNTWCNDLAKHFPFLDQRTTPHPYQRFYYIWKLSYLYGIKGCNQSLNLEQLTLEPKSTLQKLFSELSIDNKSLAKAASVIQKPSLNKWKQYADNEWFEKLEQECEQNLNSFLM